MSVAFIKSRDIAQLPNDSFAGTSSVFGDTPFARAGISLAPGTPLQPLRQTRSITSSHEFTVEARNAIQRLTMAVHYASCKGRRAGRTERIAEAFGYSADQLDSIPAEANMGLSCGNPTAFASLREGETVVDLGSGGGLDVFLAAAKVGPTGRSIGIDMTPEMLALARANAAKAGLANVEFYEIVHHLFCRNALACDAVMSIG